MLQSCKNIVQDSLLSSDQRNGKKKLGMADQEMITCRRGFPVPKHVFEKRLSDYFSSFLLLFPGEE